MSPPGLDGRVLLVVGIVLVACASPAAEAPRAASSPADALPCSGAVPMSGKKSRESASASRSSQSFP